MNQILQMPKTSKHKWLFKLELIVSLIVIFSSLLYLPYLAYQENRRNNISNTLVQQHSISKLYNPINLTYENNTSSSPLVIGTLEIPSIEVTLPVISEMNDELLKLSICRFYGPLPNENGNICIAGHNYNDGSFFSNVPNLVIGDPIYLTDLYNNKCAYKVYNKYEINAKDTSCTNQETNGKKEITLVTCNNFTGNRIIIKAKMTKAY